MQSKSTLSLKHKLLITGILLAVAPLFTLGIIFWRQLEAVSATAQDAAGEVAGSYLAQAGETASGAVVDAQNDVTNALRTARASLNGYGGLQFVKHRRTPWEVTNQDTKETKKLSLPAVSIGRKPGRGWKAPPKLLVDDVKDLTGATCTVFQRMNPEGDMLRISTNVLTAEGKRATGTYIPAVSPAGKPNPVLLAVLAGKRYCGKATIVGKQYITAYEPITGQDGAVIGMLYTGLSEQSEAQRLKARLTNMQATQHGEVFALSTAAANKGDYLFSTHEEAPTVPTGDPRHKLIDAAMAHPTATTLQHYRSTQGVPMIAILRYFDSWQWMVGVALPEQEYLQTPRQIDGIVRGARNWIGTVFLISLLASVLIWTRCASVLTVRLAVFARHTQEDGVRILAWAKRLRASSKVHGSGISEQLMAVEKSSEQIQGAARENELRAEKALGVSAQSDQQNQATQEQLAGMQSSMQQLISVNTKISGLMKTVDEIAFQSRILALNARIEAARAGEAGVSFAVVADQFGSLAQRCADAAQSTTDFLTESARSTQSGMEKLRDLSSSVEQMTSNSVAIRATIAEVRLATGQQVQAAAEIGRSLSTIKLVIAQNAQMTEQNEHAGNELQCLANELNAHTADLSRMVEGSKAKRALKPQLVKSQPKQPAKRPLAQLPTARASAAKAPANNRSARRAC